MLEEGGEGPRAKWVDVSKGDNKNPEYGRRLVDTEMKRDRREDLFAAMPPLGAKKMLFALWARKPGMCVKFIDVVRTYSHARVRRMVDV